MAQVSLTEFRLKYPQYSGKSDQELADALHAKFYATVPRADFDARIGLAAPGNVSAPSPAFSDALAGASAKSQFFAGNPDGARPAPTPGTSPNIKTTGLVENIGAGIDSGANRVLGAPVDIPVWLGNSLVNAANSGLEMAGAGRPVPKIPNDLPGSSQGFERAQAGLGFTPPSSVVPADSGQAIARAAAEATTMAAIPEALVIRGGQLLQQAPVAVKAGVDTLEALFGGSRTAGQFGRNMAVNAAAGAGAEGAMQAAPDGWEPAAGLAGGLTAATTAYGFTSLPGVVQKALSTLGEYLAPLSKRGQQDVAGRVLRENATNPGQAIDDLTYGQGEILPGSQPTTFQQTGDMGLGQLERGVATKDPAPFNQRAADQNAVRVTALENVQPTGAPEQVAASVRSFLDDMDLAAEQTIDAATKKSAGRVNALGVQADAVTGSALSRAQEATNALGAGIDTTTAGATMRESLESSRAAAKEQERALWKAVDPDGSLTLGSENTKSGAAQIRTEMPASAKPMSGEEDAIFSVAASLGDEAPFSELTALQSRLKTELRQERLANGESPAYRRLSILNNSIQQDLEAAIVGRVRQDSEAVAAGIMRVEDTLASNVQKWVDDWQNQRTQAAVGLGDPGGGAASARGATPGAGGISGTAGQAGFGPVSTSGNPGLPPNPLGAAADAGAIDRLNAARNATRTRAETFDNKTLAPLRKRPSTTAPYDVASGTVPSRIFSSNAKSPEAIQTFRNAVGDEQAMPILRDYAMGLLRKAALRDDGTIDPVKATTWLRQHQDALRSFPALESGVRNAARASEQAAETSALQQAAKKAAQSGEDKLLAATAKAERLKLDEAKKGIVGRLLGVSDPQDVTRAIGSIFSRQDAVAQMKALVKAIGSSSEGKEGLRKAVVDYLIERFVGNTEAATSGLGTMKSDQIQTFVSKNKPALEAAGFSGDELRLFDDIAEDLQRANRSIASVKRAGGSNTAQDLLAATSSGGKASMLLRAIAAHAKTSGAGVATGILFGPWVGIPVYAGTLLGSAFRQRGIESIEGLIRDAMLDPALARELMVKATPEAVKERALTLAQMLSRNSVVSAVSVANEARPSNAEGFQDKAPQPAKLSTPPAAMLRPSNALGLSPQPGMALSPLMSNQRPGNALPTSTPRPGNALLPPPQFQRAGPNYLGAGAL